MLPARVVRLPKMDNEDTLPDETKEQANGAPSDFLDELEAGVKAVLHNKRAKPSERVAAIAAGVKIVFARHKISGADEDNFFK